MISLLRLLATILVGALAGLILPGVAIRNATQAITTSSITKKSGQIVKGEIKGRIVLESSLSEVEKDSKKYGVVFYLLVDGRSIAAIDQTGVNLSGGPITLLLVSWELKNREQQPSDVAALKADSMEMGPNPVAFADLDSGALVSRVRLNIRKASTVNQLFSSIREDFKSSSPAFLASPTVSSVLGELRSAQEKQVLIPTLELSTSQGIAKLEVDEVVSFTGSQKVDQGQSVSFTLYHYKKPFDGEQIAIFPVEADEIKVSDDNRLGVGRTDSNGHANIEFHGQGKFSKYALLWRLKNGAYIMLRHEGSALTFECNVSKPACDLGNLVFEEFHFKSA